MTDYTIGVVMYVIVIIALVALLLVGAFLVINLGLMSKRPEDHVGNRTPSDVGLLKYDTWPPQPVIRDILPAEEDDYVDPNNPPLPKTPAA